MLGLEVFILAFMGGQQVGVSVGGARASGGVGEWLGPESNREPTDYETVALTS